MIPAELIYSRTKGFRLLRTTKTPIYDAEGVSIALLAVSEDITDREQSEAELRGAVEFLENVNSELLARCFNSASIEAGTPQFPTSALVSRRSWVILQLIFSAVT